MKAYQNSKIFLAKAKQSLNINHIIDKESSTECLCNIDPAIQNDGKSPHG